MTAINAIRMAKMAVKPKAGVVDASLGFADCILDVASGELIAG
jgi:hypothetical protein